MKIRLTREIALPDPRAVARARRAPEAGPRVLFFSGGSALTDLSRALKRLTHQSIHLITPFDSGGSSAKLRTAFRMPSVGDLRSRLVALADEDDASNGPLYRLLTHRLGGESDAAQADFRAMVAEAHPLVAALPRSLRSLVVKILGIFADRAPSDFDHSGASLGNLVLAGAFLDLDRDLGAALRFLSDLLAVRGVVRPVVDADCELAAELEDGRRIFGQHRLTGKELAPLEAPIRRLELVDAAATDRVVTLEFDQEGRELVAGADLVCFPMGSFHTSVLANLLPRGVGRAVADRCCPKVFVPGLGADPELPGVGVADQVAMLLKRLRDDAGDRPVSELLTHVLLDAEDAGYGREVEAARIAALGVEVLRMPLVEVRPAGPRIDARRLAEVLVTMGG